MWLLYEHPVQYKFQIIPLLLINTLQMFRLLNLPLLKLGMIVGVGALGFRALKLKCYPLKPGEIELKNKSYLNEQMKAIKYTFRKAFNAEFPATNCNVDKNDTYKVSYEFATTKALNHLNLFNKMLELFHSHRNPEIMTIEKTSRKINGDVVIYSFVYKTILEDCKRSTVYLIGDTKKDKYTLIVEKKGPFNEMELMILINIAKEIQNYGAMYEIEGKCEEGNTEAIKLLSIFECKVKGIDKNIFNSSKHLKTTSIQSSINAILKNKTNEDHKG